MPERLLKIVSINTWKGDGDYFQRMKVLARQLHALEADVILCQECFASTDYTIDTVKHLSKELQLDYLFTPARLKDRLLGDTWTTSFSGLGILSRYPCALVQDFSFTLIPDDGERKAQITAINLPGDKKVIFVNVHLTHLPNATVLRCDQILQLAQEIKKLNLTGEICIIGGDFNAEMNSTELNLLHSTLLSKDCYCLGYGKIPREIFNNFQIQKNVDHLVVVPGKNNGYPDFKNSAVVLNQADAGTGLYPSDHSGITTTLILPE